MIARGGIALLLAVGLACHAAAQTVAAGADPLAMARVALGTEVGTASVATWRDGRLAQATLRRQPGADAAALAASDPVDGPALFEIGSISKLFTGLLLAQAVERGDLSLDDSLGKLLQGKIDFASPKVAAITLRQLVSHSSCLPRQFGAPRNAGAIADQITLSGRIDLMAALQQQQIEQDAPCPAVYSNYGMALLGELLSEHYGKPWDALVDERIARPLGLRDTRQQMGDQAHRLVTAYSGASPAKPWDMKAFAGAGGLRASVQDLVAFGRALLAGGKGPLGPAAERMLSPVGSYQGMAIGYAVFIHGPPGRRTYSHDGLTGGYRALLAMAPDTGDVVAAMVSNRQAPLPQMAQDWWARRYPVSDQAVAIDAAVLPGLAGVYQGSAQLQLIVTTDGRQLFVRSRGSVFRAYLPVAVDTFTRPAGGARVVFERDGKGAVTGMVLEQAGGRYEARRDGAPPPAGQVLAEGRAQHFVGHYAVAPGGGPAIAFDVRAQDGQLMVRSSRFPWEPVFAMDGRVDRFRYDIPDAELQFERDANGQVVALVLHQRGALRAVRTEPGSR